MCCREGCGAKPLQFIPGCQSGWDRMSSSRLKAINHIRCLSHHSELHLEILNDLIQCSVNCTCWLDNQKCCKVLGHYKLLMLTFTSHYTGEIKTTIDTHFLSQNNIGCIYIIVLVHFNILLQIWYFLPPLCVHIRPVSDFQLCCQFTWRIVLCHNTLYR